MGAHDEEGLGSRESGVGVGEMSKCAEFRGERGKLGNTFCPWARIEGRGERLERARLFRSLEKLPTLSWKEYLSRLRGTDFCR